LGHFEGRSWTGLHRHALMTCIAFAWLQHLRLARQRPAGSGKNAGSGSGTATITEPASRAPRHHGTAVRRPDPADPMPTLQTQAQAAT
jgi:SRSO17 transposase